VKERPPGKLIAIFLMVAKKIKGKTS